MSYADHDHGGEYASDNHDHYDYAEKYHRHYDDESAVRGLRQDLGAAEERIRALEDDLRDALERIRALEGQTPQARRLQLEADQAMADLAESGYDRHGRDCQCSYCATDDDPEAAEYDPGPVAPSPGGYPESSRADDPDEPTTREIEPDPADWHDGPDPADPPEVTR